MTNKVKGTCVPVEYLVLGMLENNVYIIPTARPPSWWIPRASPTRSSSGGGLGRRHHPHASPFGPRGAAKELRDKTGATVIASAIDAPIIRARRSCRATTCASRRARWIM